MLKELKETFHHKGNHLFSLILSFFLLITELIEPFKLLKK